MALTWLRLDLPRRWRSLVVLALLVALSSAVVLTAVAGARRGESAFDRLWARTLPATVAVLPNQPGFDWAKVQALPGVAAMALFAVYYGASVDGIQDANIGWPPANAALFQTVEHPVILAGRAADQSRADEAMASPHFMSAHHLRVGDTVTLHLTSPAQAAAGFNATQGGTLAGPRVKLTHRRRGADPVLSRRPRRHRRGHADPRPVHPVPRRHHGAEPEREPDLHQRPDPAVRRGGGDPGVPRGARQGDGTLRHRRVGRLRPVRRRRSGG